MHIQHSMLKQALAATFAAMLLVPSVQAAIYKWVDEQGNVHYGERPATEATSKQRMDIRLREPTPAATEDTSASSEKTKAGQTEKQTEAGAEADKQAEPKQPEKPKMSRKEKRGRCADARKRLNVLTTKNQVRERDKKGNLRYMGEEERQQRIKSARKNVKKYCR